MMYLVGRLVDYLSWGRKVNLREVSSGLYLDVKNMNVFLACQEPIIYS